MLIITFVIMIDDYNESEVQLFFGDQSLGKVCKKVTKALN